MVATSGFLAAFLASATYAQSQSAAANPAGAPRTISKNYILRPSDVLSFQVFQEPDMNQQVRLDADGAVIFPLIGRVNLGGMTIEEAQRYLTEVYDRDYLVNPQISLLVVEFAPRLVQVLGQVNSPGPVPIPPDRDLTVVEAISASNGQTRLANLRKVVVRRNTEDRETVTFELDVQQMMTDEDSQDFILIEDDTIFVPERTI